MTSILYQNAAKDITLVDIPTSIALALGASHSDVILSQAPLKEPFIIHNEPKKKAARERNALYTATETHAQYKPVIEQALLTIRANMHFGGSWCFPRKIIDQVRRSKVSDMEIDDPEKILERILREWSTFEEVSKDPFDFQTLKSALGATSEPNATSIEPARHAWVMSHSPACAIWKEAHGDESKTSRGPWKSAFHNSHEHAVDLTVSDSPTRTEDTPHKYRFRIPPRASFFLGDSTNPGAFRASFRDVTEEYVLPRHFDFVLLDPPWPSHSAKNKGAYEQVGGMPYMRKVLSNLDIDNYLEHNALVGIWITNKKAVRDFVLGANGLFEQWNVGLVEEWIWIKTTIKGEPMFSLDSQLRKPYETLLIGRAAPNSWAKMEHAAHVSRRVIAAVPDMHSRKPCVKELVEPFLPDDYNALEIFARYLVSGWTSWGNEAIKFNWDHYWISYTGEGA